MESVKLKCQFCPLMDFSSAYKIIPHIYFGHRKKITKYVREKSEINLKCPLTTCDYSHSEPVVPGTPAEQVYVKMAEMFLVMEDHIISAHTKEEKLVQCPYCQKDLSNIVYWVHLEEHMNQAPSSPATPAKTTSPAPPVSQTTPNTPQATTPVSPAKAISPAPASITTPKTPITATQNISSPNLSKWCNCGDKSAVEHLKKSISEMSKVGYFLCY